MEVTLISEKNYWKNKFERQKELNIQIMKANCDLNLQIRFAKNTIMEDVTKFVDVLNERKDFETLALFEEIFT